MNPTLTFPESGYVGVAAEIAEAYAECYESPKEFFYVDLLTLIGASLSGRWQADFDLPCQPRLYTIKIAPSAWSRKSTSLRMMQQELGGLNLPGAAQTLYGAGSAEGLGTALSADEEIPEIAKASRPKRVVLYQDEFRRLEAKMSLKGSALLPLLNELYESNIYDNPTITHGSLHVENGHLALVTNTTTASYEKLLNSSEMKDLGFLNRLFLVTGGTKRKVARPKRPSAARLGPLRQQLRELFEQLPPFGSGPVIVPLTTEAEEMWAAWYESLEESEETARLDNLGMRLFGLLSFINGQREIDAKLTQAVLDILEYQKRIRHEIRPEEGETISAKHEQRVLNALEKRENHLTPRDLERYTNASRHGLKLHAEVLQTLIRNGKVVMREGEFRRVA